MSRVTRIVLFVVLCILCPVLTLSLAQGSTSQEPHAPPDVGPTPAPGELLDWKVTADAEGRLVIKWRTAELSKGEVAYGPQGRLDHTAHDIRGQGAIDTVHWVRLAKLDLDQLYDLAIVRDGTETVGLKQALQPRSLLSEQMNRVAREAAPIPTPAPGDVLNLTVTPEGESGFLVKWTTPTAGQSWIEYNTGMEQQFFVAYDVRGQEIVDIVHYVLLDQAAVDAEWSFVTAVGPVRYVTSLPPAQRDMRLTIESRD